MVTHKSYLTTRSLPRQSSIVKVFSEFTPSLAAFALGGAL